jgi:hypothetical protein
MKLLLTGMNLSRRPWEFLLHFGTPAALFFEFTAMAACSGGRRTPVRAVAAPTVASTDTIVLRIIFAKPVPWDAYVRDTPQAAENAGPNVNMATFAVWGLVVFGGWTCSTICGECSY